MPTGRGAGLTYGAVLVCAGVVLDHGTLGAASLTLVVLGTILIGLALFGTGGVGSMSTVTVRTIYVAMALLGLLDIGPVILRHVPSPAWMAVPAVLFGVGWIAGWDLLGSAPRRRRGSLVVLLLSTLSLGVWLIWLLGAPFIDVYVFHTDASAAVLDATNPYDITFPEISGNPDFYYGPGIAEDGVLDVGYPYTPVNLLFTVPGYLLGDVRLLFLAAAVAGGWLLSRLGANGRIGAVLFLSTPTFFRAVLGSWNETLLVFGFALTMWALVRRDRLAPWALGFFGAIKQYSIVVAPLFLLTIPRPWRWATILRPAIEALSVVAVLTLPLALLDLPAFSWSVIGFQFAQPFRSDALSVLAASVNGLGWPPAAVFAWLPVVAALVAMVACLRRAPAGPYGFAASTALVMLVFVLFSKQAFLNYYFFATSAAFAAVAAFGAGTPGTVETPLEAHSG